MSVVESAAMHDGPRIGVYFREFRKLSPTDSWPQLSLDQGSPFEHSLHLANCRFGRAVAQSGSALAWGARGPGFESLQPEISAPPIFRGRANHLTGNCAASVALIGCSDMGGPISLELLNQKRPTTKSGGSYSPRKGIFVVSFVASFVAVFSLSPDKARDEI